MTMKLAFALAAILIGMGIAHLRQAEATLVELDLIAPGDALVTLDDSTGLQWLDMSLTLGLSHNDLTGGIGNSWYADGWRHASVTEICGLFTAQLGIAGDPCPHPDDVVVIDPALAEAFFALMEPVDDGVQRFLSGAYGEYVPVLGPGVGQASMIVNSIVGPPHHARVEEEHIGLSPNIHNASIGNWLVRPIPEPSTALLLGIGLAAMAVTWRRA